MSKENEFRLLEFLNPELEAPGTRQVTVRKGDKWKGADGDTVVIRETGKKKDLAMARVLTTAQFPLAEVPQDVLNLEHDPACRTPDGLFKAMERAYPGIQADDVVTVVTFEVLDEPKEAKQPDVSPFQAPTDTDGTYDVEDADGFGDVPGSFFGVAGKPREPRDAGKSFLDALLRSSALKVPGEPKKQAKLQARWLQKFAGILGNAVERL